MVTCNVGDTIPIGDGSLYRAYCYKVSRFKTKWILQEFKKHSFLFWKWEKWESVEFITNYGAGDTHHNVEIDRRDETDQEMIWLFESDLEFLGLDYE